MYILDDDFNFIYYFDEGVLNKFYKSAGIQDKTHEKILGVGSKVTAAGGTSAAIALKIQMKKIEDDPKNYEKYKQSNTSLSYKKWLIQNNEKYKKLNIAKNISIGTAVGGLGVSLANSSIRTVRKSNELLKQQGVDPNEIKDSLKYGFGL